MDIYAQKQRYTTCGRMRLLMKVHATVHMWFKIHF